MRGKLARHESDIRGAHLPRRPLHVGDEADDRLCRGVDLHGRAMPDGAVIHASQTFRSFLAWARSVTVSDWLNHRRALARFLHAPMP